jgi:hypothetical protein
MKPAGTWMVLMLAISCAPANAANVGVRLSSPHQVNSSERVEVGMIVDARTNTLTMTAGGGYTLTCPDTTPLTAQRALQFTRWPAGFVVSVFVPETIPATYAISGWYSWNRPSTHYCTFSYVGRAKDAWVNLSGFGVNITLGGEDVTAGDSVVFPMVKPAPPTPPGGGGCQPVCSCIP